MTDELYFSTIDVTTNILPAKHYNAYYNVLKDKLGQNVLDHIRGRAICSVVSEVILTKTLYIKPKRILEIGRFRGFSMGMFKYFFPDSEIVSVDIEMHPEVNLIMELLGKIELIHGTSDDLPEGRYDCVLIDGEHSYDGALKDWNNVKGKINKNGIVIFDNVAMACGQVFYDIASENKYKCELYIEDDDMHCGCVTYE